MKRITHLTPERLRALHAEYERRARAREARVLVSLAAGAGVSQWYLRRAFKRAGLPGLNIKPGQPTRRLVDDAWVHEAHRRYLAGERPKTLQREFNSPSHLTQLFKSRGLALRHNPRFTQFVKLARKTDAEIAALIKHAAAAPRVVESHTLKVPDELRNEWREWPLERRADFIRRLRAAMALPNDAPTTPLSSNVEPFDYGSPSAWAIVNAANAGLASRHWRMRLFPSGQGMIWRGQLWFWIRDSGGRNRGCYQGAFVNKGASKNRPQLHREIYAAEVGPIPRGHVVRFRDNNFNNLAPSNLYTQSRADEASENRRNISVKKTRELTALLLQRHEQAKNHEHSNDDLVRQMGARSAAPGRSARRGLSSPADAEHDARAGHK